MTATTVDRLTPARDNRDFSFPVAASTVIRAGVIVGLNAGGFLVEGLTSTTLKTVGVSQERVDNSAGANGAVNAPVRRGLHRFANSAAGDLIALTDIGTSCYVVDNQTVAKTNGTSTRSVAGTVRDVDASGVWVEF